MENQDISMENQDKSRENQDITQKINSMAKLMKTLAPNTPRQSNGYTILAWLLFNSEFSAFFERLKLDEDIKRRCAIGALTLNVLKTRLELAKCPIAPPSDPQRQDASPSEPQRQDASPDPSPSVAPERQDASPDPYNCKYCSNRKKAKANHTCGDPTCKKRSRTENKNNKQSDEQKKKQSRTDKNRDGQKKKRCVNVLD